MVGRETLREVIDKIDGLADHLVVYIPADQALSADTLVLVQDYAGPGRAPSGMKSMMLVEDIKTTLDAWRRYHPGREPSPEEKVEAVIYFHLNDAYLP